MRIEHEKIGIAPDHRLVTFDQALLQTFETRQVTGNHDLITNLVDQAWIDQIKYFITDELVIIAVCLCPGGNRVLAKP